MWMFVCVCVCVCVCMCSESVCRLKRDVFPSPRKKNPTRGRGVCMCAVGNKIRNRKPINRGIRAARRPGL
ncbi:hypothetical protein CMEL01_07067 [Colletotrichum melonis]|uniref:Secreted protein n=1 Tax=Colletotrichum melonis TaxID=1209925 RepID=A0AAI9XJ51_9PEZI|nr:hypothetical protein CMEL01_07067 [Colletotrichum melonis]